MFFVGVLVFPIRLYFNVTLNYVYETYSKYTK